MTEESARDHRRSLTSGVSMGGKGPDVHMYRNALKSYVYLVSWFLSDFSKLRESKGIESKLRKKSKKNSHEEMS